MAIFEMDLLLCLSVFLRERQFREKDNSGLSMSLKERLGMLGTERWAAFGVARVKTKMMHWCECMSDLALRAG